MDSCVERILEAISSLGIDQKSFAQMIGVRPQAITDWKNGKTVSYKRHIEKIAEALGTTTEYLLTGEGPKKKPAPAVSDSDTISEDEIKAAFWGGDKDLSQEDLDAMWKDVKRFAAFVAQQKKQEKQHD